MESDWWQKSLNKTHDISLYQHAQFDRAEVAIFLKCNITSEDVIYILQQIKSHIQK